MKKFVLIICFQFLVLSISALEQGDKIRVMVNKVSPYVNPTESYRYYDLPFCAPSNTYEESQSLGEKLTGNRKMNSLYEIAYGVNTPRRQICEQTYTNDQLEKFRNVIKQNYLFEMFIEDIPVGNSVGVYKDGRIYLANTLKFTLYYNPTKGSVVTAEVTHEDNDLIDITQPITAQIPFYYIVQFIPTDIEATINSSYDTFFTDDGHWFSIMNSFVLMTLLIVLVWQILVKTETFSTKQIDAEANDRISEKGDEAGWKFIRIEAFKCPPQRNVLCAAVGSGFQLILILVFLFFIGAFGYYYNNRGLLATAAILCYAFTAECSGFVSARMYKYLGGDSMAANLILSACLFPIPLFVVALILNNFAWVSHSTAALPFSSILFIFFMWVLVSLPLTILGGITGRRGMDETLVDVGDKLPKISKPIPRQPFYMRLIPSVLLSGVLPFSALCMELNYIFNSLWGHKVYTMWSVIFLVFIMVLNMTACISIIQTYFQLNAKDYRWWWRSFFIGGSTSFYVFLYALYFYIQKSAMVGFLQAAYFVGYTTILCLILLLMLGSVGFLSSMAFVKYIYERSKVE